MGAFIAKIVAQKAAGKLVGMLSSKTVLASSAGHLAGFSAALPGALAGDSTQIGLCVGMVVTWALSVYGRMTAITSMSNQPSPAKQSRRK